MTQYLTRIREALPEDRAQWLPLWRAYNAFYETSLPDAVTEATWRRIHAENRSIGCLVAEENGQLLGFLHYVTHPRTWSVTDACYLEDLYVDASARGRGIGKALCMELKKLCDSKGLSRIYWHTRESNATARALYDQIAKKDDFVRYIMPLSAL